MRRWGRIAAWAGVAVLAAAGVFYAFESQRPAKLAHTKFYAIDVFVDTGRESLAAWQIEVRDRAGLALLTSVEGGEHEAFVEPPHYDARALQNHRVVLVAYHLGPTYPAGRTRVATLHFAQERAGQPRFEAKLVTAARPDGSEVRARVEIKQ